MDTDKDVYEMNLYLPCEGVVCGNGGAFHSILAQFWISGGDRGAEAIIWRIYAVWKTSLQDCGGGSALCDVTSAICRDSFANATILRTGGDVRQTRRRMKSTG